MPGRIAALMMALSGAFFFVVFVLQDVRIHPELTWDQLPWSLIARYAVAMTAGGALAGVVFSGLFGRSGTGGWFLALLGGAIASLLSGLFGSAFGLLPDLLADGLTMAELIKVVLGALVVPLSVIEQPFLLIVLIGLVLATHELCKRARQSK